MLPPGDSWTRRDFLKVVSRTGMLTAVPGLAAAAATFGSDAITVSILHTTDLHGHILPTVNYDGTPNLGGMARCITQIRRWRRQNPNTILIDAGDVYQGTDLGLRSKGGVMIDLFNHLKYDGWIVGNHEFDWGIGAFADAVERSSMPVLAANMSVEGRPAGELAGEKHPFAKIQPYLLKEIAGIRIAIIGVTTPGMPFWFRPEFTRDLHFDHPVEPVRRAISKAKAEGAHAILLAGHMGIKSRGDGDDFANCVTSLTAEFPEIAVFIAGHTHQPIGKRLVNNVLVTQADHFGIHVGRVDLVFDRGSKRLLGRDAHCELMDRRFRADHVVLSRTRSLLKESHAALREPVGVLAETLRAHNRSGYPSDVTRLIGTAIGEALRERGTPVDGVFHGVFDGTHDMPAGLKRVDDIWKILPYENYVVTAELAPDELKMVLDEAYSAREERSLIGFQVLGEGNANQRRVTSLTLEDGRRLERGRRYPVAFNSFDSSSAGHKFMKLRALLENPSVQCRLHDVQTRDALIDYFRRHKVVPRIMVGADRPVAA